MGQWPSHSRLAENISVGPFPTFSGKLFFFFFFMGQQLAVSPPELALKSMNESGLAQEKKKKMPFSGKFFFPRANGPAIGGWQEKKVSDPLPHFRANFFSQGRMAPPFAVCRKWPRTLLQRGNNL
jgi:hypothetical protein